MKDFVSIIIPVYNVEKYLNKCIDSVIKQSYKNLEIILIDDGSTDKSCKICDDFSCKDDRIKVIHKKNGGLSDARNVGIDNATSKFIMFIDSDDWIASDYVETYLKIIKETQSDMVIGELLETFSYDVNKKELKNVATISKEDLYKKMFLGDGTVISACAKMYKKELFSKVRYDVGKLYEDFLIFDKIVENSNKIVLFDYAGYFYLIRDNSIMRSSYNENRWILIDKSAEYMELVEKKYPDLKMAALRRYIFSCFNILSRTIVDKKYDVVSKKIRSIILEHKKDINSNIEFSKRDVLQTKLIGLGLIPYRLMINLHYKLKRMKKR